MSESLEPLWEVFPDHEWYSMGFRMGCGEEYLDEWKEWYWSLSDKVRAEYQLLWPEPKERGWPGFYERFDRAKK